MTYSNRFSVLQEPEVAVHSALCKPKPKRPLVFVDASYLIFYTYYTVFRGYKQWVEDGTLDLVELMHDPSFQQHFYAKLCSNITRLTRTFHTPYHNIIISKDCGRQLVWRKQHFSEYKENRTKCTKTFNVSIFGFTYTQVLPRLVKEYGVRVMESNGAEADDIIGVIHRYIRKYDKERPIVIVANDNDYLQLADPNTIILNLKQQKLQERFPLMDPEEDLDGRKYLRYKILVGDPSDNIRPLIEQLDRHDVKELVDDHMRFNRLVHEPHLVERYKSNRLLIDFGMVPCDLKNDIIQQFKLSKMNIRTKFEES